ncbi:S1 family peptidase [Streptomyces sp. bgisy100]|uniref:S1 family peptidase n=1 Tax=Streptomyces sp. bgisy100 TaxID=3413783 RepID=UPI003D71FC67
MSKKSGTIAGASLAAFAAAAVLLPNANAGTNTPDDPGPRAFSLEEAGSLGARLSADLGADSAGWYFDNHKDRMVMNVLDEAAARKVRAKGGEARVVERSMAELRAGIQQLNKDPVPGTAWSVDPRTNKVSVIADGSVTGDRWKQLSRSTGKLGDAVSVTKVEGTFVPTAADGGDSIFGDQGGTCSLGFNVQKDGKAAFLTAGHCSVVSGSKAWGTEQGGRPVGKVVEEKFPGADYALVTYDEDGAEAPSTVDLKNGRTQAITSAAAATVGMPVQRSGQTTGLHGGKVTGIDVTVNYPQGSVDGLIQTNVCSEPGDSGGSLFSGNKAVGLTSGGEKDSRCPGESVSFYQPVTDALQAVGARIGEGGKEQGPGDDSERGDSDDGQDEGGQPGQ